MFIFKGLSSDSQGLKEKQPHHSILPPIEARTLDLPLVHGGIDYGRRYGMREIEVQVSIKSNSYTNLRTKIRQIAKWLNSENLERLSFSDEPDKYYMARVVDSTVLDDLYLYEETTLKFLCPSPFAFSLTEATGSLTKGGTLQHTMLGTIDTYPVFTITFTAATSSYTISSTVGTQSYLIELKDNFIIGDVVKVDCGTGKITVNGSTRQNILTLDSDLIVLKEGVNYIWSGNQANVSYAYKQRWL
jgi:predicted phage tail component-like protein